MNSHRRAGNHVVVVVEVENTIDVPETRREVPWTVETSHDHHRPAASSFASSSSSPSSWWSSSPTPRETVLRPFVFVEIRRRRSSCMCVRVQDAEPESTSSQTSRSNVIHACDAFNSCLTSGNEPDKLTNSTGGSCFAETSREIQ